MSVLVRVRDPTSKRVCVCRSESESTGRRCRAGTWRRESSSGGLTWCREHAPLSSIALPRSPTQPPPRLPGFASCVCSCCAFCFGMMQAGVVVATSVASFSAFSRQSVFLSLSLPLPLSLSAPCRYHPARPLSSSSFSLALLGPVPVLLRNLAVVCPLTMCISSEALSSTDNVRLLGGRRWVSPTSKRTSKSRKSTRPRSHSPLLHAPEVGPSR